MFSSDRPRRGRHILQIGFPIHPGWRTHGDEDEFRPVQGIRVGNTEGQPARRHIAPDKFIQARFVDRHDAIVEILDALLIHVERDHFVAQVSETSSRNKAHVPHSHDTDLLHQYPLSPKPGCWMSPRSLNIPRQSASMILRLTFMGNFWYIDLMRLLFVADGRSPIALNWIRYFAERGDEVYLASTFDCSPDLPLKGLEFTPVAYSQALNRTRALKRRA